MECFILSWNFFFFFVKKFLPKPNFYSDLSTVVRNCPGKHWYNFLTKCNQRKKKIKKIDQIIIEVQIKIEIRLNDSGALHISSDHRKLIDINFFQKARPRLAHMD